MPERFIGVEQARGQLGRLVDDVAGGSEAISLTERGRPVAVLVNRDGWEALQPLVRTEAREELRRVLSYPTLQAVIGDADELVEFLESFFPGT